MTRRRELEDLIASEEGHLAALSSEIESHRALLEALRKELDTLPPSSLGASRESYRVPPVIAHLSNAEKIGLFRSLFRGREDVFPRRWENPKTGKSGYAPACRNEWVNDLCRKAGFGTARKPKSTCGDCPKQAFLPVTEEEIAKHLKGQHTMGVYPLLQDETCWFLAVDFDGSAWQEDVAIFAETCRMQNLSVAIERSRSGNGAHAWFFFSAPVPAAAARRMGCYLITETMSRRHQLSMNSYDRLFPNQDTMPKGGFGNLIALPLQREARANGNSVFLDDQYEPLSDQWAYLSGIRRLDLAILQSLVAEATRQGQIIGIRSSNNFDDGEQEPWDWPRTCTTRQLAIKEQLPSLIHVVLAQRLFVEKACLPSALLDQIKRLAAFQNPEFYKKQSLRLSTALTPRVITCFDDLTSYVSLPRGCLAELEGLLREHGVSLTIEDKREDGPELDLRFVGNLTPAQEQALQAFLSHEMGVFVAPPGTGKTVVGVRLIAERKKNTLILVHRKPLLDQWISQLALFLGISTKEIGQIGAGKNKPNGQLDVAMIQSLVRKGQVDDRVAGYGHVVVDECHHCPAVSFEMVLSKVKARYVTGLTATPRRRDGHHPIIHMQLGPVRFAVAANSQAARCPFNHLLIVRETGFKLGSISGGESIQEIYSALAGSQQRNDMIFDDVLHALEEGRSPLLLTERRDHLEHLAGRLRKFTRNLVVLHGGMKPKERREALARCMAIPEEEERLLLATGRFLGEGFDDGRLDTLFLALPVSWKGTLVQYTGRLRRVHLGKAEVRVYDYVDREVPALRKMFEKRLRGYHAIGYIQEMEAPNSIGPDHVGVTAIPVLEENP